MSSHKFALVLLSTTVFGLLPMTAAAADVTLDKDAIQKAQTSDNTFKATNGQNVNITDGTTLSSGELTVTADNANSVFKGTLTAYGDNTPKLTITGIGNFPWSEVDEKGNYLWQNWTAQNTTGWTNLNGSSSTKAAVEAQNAILDVSNSVFANSNNTISEGARGGALFVSTDTVFSSNANVYFNNQTTTDGGAIVVNSNKNNTLVNDWFVKNKAGGAGGAIDILGNVGSIHHTVFGKNESGTAGGAIYVGNDGTVGTITQGIFEQNTAGTSGGAIYNRGKISSIENSRFTSNAAEDGGAIFMQEGSSAKVSGSTFTGNTATANPQYAGTGFGGAIAVFTNADLTTEGNTFTGNKVLGDASVAGGAVHNDNGTWTSTDDVFTGNSSSTDGGAIGTNGNTTLKNAQITDNTANVGRGGGIVARSSNGPAQLNIEGGIISQNTAAVGGGLANINLEGYNAQRSNVTINGTEISGNKAIENGSNAQSGHGGGIYNAQDLTVTNATVSNNTAVSGAGIYNDQGGTTTIDGTVTISGNTASGNGGAIYNNGQLTVKGSGVTIKGNNAVLGQNLYNDENGIVNIENADDQIDLNYMPYPDSTTPRPTGELHTLFDQTQDIYNRGTMNITDSNLQLHQGINTSSTLTDDSERKVGKVNITNSTVDLGGSDVPGAGVMYGDQVNINANSTIKTHVNKDPDGKHGQITANNIYVAPDNTTLDVVVSSGTLGKGEKKQYQVLNGAVNGDFTDFGKHANYETRALGNGNYEVYRKGENACPGCDENEVNTNNGWLDGSDMTQNSDAYDIQQQLFEAGEGQREALDGLAPDVSPLVQAHATEITQRLASIVNDRFYESMERTGYIHRGKRFYRFPRHDSNLWVQGLYGKSKYDVRKGWDMDNRGISVGFDGHVSDAVRLGVAYAYTKSSGESVQRDTDIKSHTGMIYGNYNPNRFYANWLAMYTRSKYDEDKKVFNHNVKASYDVDAFGAQLMLGRKMGPYVSGDWATGVIKPEIGARYVYTKQHAYTDTVGQSVGSADGNTLTGILGAQYTIGYTLSPTLSWYPELRAALTYDFVEPDTKMRVNLLNGSVYEVKTENMDRFGIEVGARIGLDINRKAEVALEYEGLFKGDYTNHTGLANLKYKF